MDMSLILASGPGPAIPGFRGKVLGQADPEFDQARCVANGVIDRHPALIARPVDAADVASALAFGRAAGLRIAVRAGGHSAAGHGTGDGVLVIDLSAMKGIEIDPGLADRLGRVGSGRG